jgi:hypothetical protein
MRSNEEFLFDGISMNQYRIIKPSYSHWTVAYALTYNGIFFFVLYLKLK